MVDEVVLGQPDDLRWDRLEREAGDVFGQPVDQGSAVLFIPRIGGRHRHRTTISVTEIRFKGDQTRMTDSGPSISERLARYIRSLRFEDLPTEIVERVKDHLVHHVALGLEGRNSEYGHYARRTAARLSEAGGRFSAIGERPSLELLDAVFVNCLYMHQSGQDDSESGGTHPGVLVYPTALNLAQDRTVSGRELLTACAIGYDVAMVLSAGTWAWTAPAPRRPNAIFGPVAVAATSARLLGLSESRTVNALGLACHGALGLIEGTRFIWVVYPWECQAGVFAAVLAESGFPAAPSMIEGDFGLYQTLLQEIPAEIDENLATLGSRFRITEARVKQYRASNLNAGILDTTKRVSETMDLRPEHVESILIELPESRRLREKRMEENFSKYTDIVSRIGSLPFLMARLIQDRELDHRTYLDPISDDLQSLLDSITLSFVDEAVPKYYARVTIRTSAGAVETFEHGRDGVRYPKVDREAWMAKCVGDDPPIDVGRFLRLVDELETLPDASVLLDAIEH
ncbi:MAG: MmgE/PrpD family protein [Acidimicrobiia bacterium]|nr:MmgE/PrpD family protein [Acidimicrobiia bacterium]MYF83090.1 MmgE/PrpD family protein [Acidimicrobiia bacterium]